MDKFKYLLSIDLSSYGAALAILNDFCDEENIRQLEISPAGLGAQAILLAKEAMPLQLVKGQIESLFKSQVLDIQLISEFHPDLLNVYLGQNKPQIRKSLYILEGNYVSTGLKLLNDALNKGMAAVEWRFIRTHPKNVWIAVTSDDSTGFATVEATGFKCTEIKSTSQILKQQFELS